MGKYFGTDGFRGEANMNLTADHAYKVGRFLGWYFGEKKRRAGDETQPRIVIGKDTRRSSYMFEYALWPPARMRTCCMSPPRPPWHMLPVWTISTAAS